MLCACLLCRLCADAACHLIVCSLVIACGWVCRRTCECRCCIEWDGRHPRHDLQQDLQDDMCDRDKKVCGDGEGGG
jgi:hypothetical protein